MNAIVPGCVRRNGSGREERQCGLVQRTRSSAMLGRSNDRWKRGPGVPRCLGVVVIVGHVIGRECPVGQD